MAKTLNTAWPCANYIGTVLSIVNGQRGGQPRRLHQSLESLLCVFETGDLCVVVRKEKDRSGPGIMRAPLLRSLWGVGGKQWGRIGTGFANSRRCWGSASCFGLRHYCSGALNRYTLMDICKSTLPAIRERTVGREQQLLKDYQEYFERNNVEEDVGSFDFIEALGWALEDSKKYPIFENAKQMDNFVEFSSYVDWLEEQAKQWNERLGIVRKADPIMDLLSFNKTKVLEYFWTENDPVILQNMRLLMNKVDVGSDCHGMWGAFFSLEERTGLISDILKILCTHNLEEKIAYLADLAEEINQCYGSAELQSSSLLPVLFVDKAYCDSELSKENMRSCVMLTLQVLESTFPQFNAVDALKRNPEMMGLEGDDLDRLLGKSLKGMGQIIQGGNAPAKYSPGLLLFDNLHILRWTGDVQNTLLLCKKRFSSHFKKVDFAEAIKEAHVLKSASFVKKGVNFQKKLLYAKNAFKYTEHMEVVKWVCSDHDSLDKGLCKVVKLMEMVGMHERVGSTTALRQHITRYPMLLCLPEHVVKKLKHLRDYIGESMLRSIYLSLSERRRSGADILLKEVAIERTLMLASWGALLCKNKEEIGAFIVKHSLLLSVSERAFWSYVKSDPDFEKIFSTEESQMVDFLEKTA
eukprot:Nk52_evm104s224 gene=Nk52_evmTU104s224